MDGEILVQIFSSGGLDLEKESQIFSCCCQIFSCWLMDLESESQIFSCRGLYRDTQIFWHERVAFQSVGVRAVDWQ